jgi:hypothetical protein
VHRMQEPAASLLRGLSGDHVTTLCSLPLMLRRKNLVFATGKFFDLLIFWCGGPGACTIKVTWCLVVSHFNYWPE